MTALDRRLANLGAGLAVKHGFAFKGEFFRDSGELIVLTPGNFVETGGFKYKPKEKFYDGPVPDGYLLRRGDVVVAMTEQSKGLLGSTATVPADNTFLHNQRIGLLQVTDPGLLDLRYCYHLLNSPDARNQIQATATGSKVRHTAPERIESVRIPLPDLDYQQKVAGALDSIESLIDNNRRRIEVLEEMTRLIYREWFVHFRFPGHEDVELVDSDLGRIPAGWQVRPLRDALELAYGKALKAASRQGGDVAVYGSGGVVGWHDKALVNGPGIVVGRKGNVGAVYWSDVDFYPIDTTYFVKTCLPLTFVYHLLQTLDFIDSHAAVPGLSRDQAYGTRILVPTDKLLREFNATIEPIFSLRRNLIGQASVLSETRDLVLPRLISGELDVSDLDLDLEPVA